MTEIQNSKQNVCVRRCGSVANVFSKQNNGHLNSNFDPQISQITRITPIIWNTEQNRL